MMVVSDTSPITTLLQIGRIDLLQQLYQEVVIPETVRKELSVLHPNLPAFIQCLPVGSQREVDRLLDELDRGEAEAIVLAKEKHADALLIDETEGRRVAAREGIPYIGLIGVLIQAKRAGRVSSLRQVLDELENKTAFRLSEAMKQVALRSAGES
jgi:uncharacterized protein